MEDFDFLSATDKPALLAINTKEWSDQVAAALTELGYKVHPVESHAHFHARFNQANYSVIVIDETFGGGGPSENLSLITLQTSPMALRRHATIILLGGVFETLNSLQAFSQSVHCVVNYSEIPLIDQLIQKTVAENDLFLSALRDVQNRIRVGNK